MAILHIIANMGNQGLDMVNDIRLVLITQAEKLIHGSSIETAGRKRVSVVRKWNDSIGFLLIEGARCMR